MRLWMNSSAHFLSRPDGRYRQARCQENHAHSVGKDLVKGWSDASGR